MLGKFTGKDKSDRGLNLSGRDGGLLVVCGKLRGLGSNALEDIIDEGVQNGHGAVGNTSVGVNLLKDFVDIGRVGLLARLRSLLLLSSCCGLLTSLLLLRRSLGGSLRGGLLLGGGLWWHFDGWMELLT